MKPAPPVTKIVAISPNLEDGLWNVNDVAGLEEKVWGLSLTDVVDRDAVRILDVDACHLDAVGGRELAEPSRRSDRLDHRHSGLIRERTGLRHLAEHVDLLRLLLANEDGHLRILEEAVGQPLADVLGDQIRMFVADRDLADQREVDRSV